MVGKATYAMSALWLIAVYVNMPPVVGLRAVTACLAGEDSAAISVYAPLTLS